MPSLSDVPVEVILDNLFPSIPVNDLVHLGSTNRFFATLLSDDLFWKRKLELDFNFSGAGTARTTGWKFIYRGLTHPRVFVWGEKSDGRLGMTKYPKSFVSDVPFPAELHIPGVRIVSLIAGGMSFHALGSDGQLYVWGTLNGEIPSLKSDGFSEPGKQAPTPLKLDLPAPTRGVSCGRLFSSTIDANNHVWIFTCWGRPIRLVSPLLDNSTDNSTPIQVECGWTFTSVLTKSGDVLVWWPGDGTMFDRITHKNNEMDREGDKNAHATEDGVIPCVTWDLETNPVRLPALPRLPQLSHFDELDSEEEPRLIQIAGLDNCIVGLTQQGHVLKISIVDEAAAAARRTWEYLPMFSEVEKVREHPAFSPKEGSNPEDQLEAPRVMHITHISGNFETFIVYSTGSSSIVLLGKVDANPESAPTILPALQNKSVISVVIGDYHNAALTSSGKLLTWGQYSSGALGLGDPGKIEVGKPGGYQVEEHRLAVRARRRRPLPPPVETPTEVRFDHGKRKPKDRFCFAATAAGWHMGALVIDLEPGESDDESDSSEEKDDADYPGVPLPPFPMAGPGEVPVIPHFNPGVFRIGFAGRGRARGALGRGSSG